MVIFILRKDIRVGGWSRKWQFPLNLYSENVLTQVVQKSLKTPLRSIKIAPKPLFSLKSYVSRKTFGFSNLISSHHVICTGVNWMKSFSYYPLCHCLASYCATIIIIMITSFWGFPVCLTPWKIRKFDGKKEGENSSRIYGHLESSYRQLMTQPWSSRF